MKKYLSTSRGPNKTALTTVRHRSKSDFIEYPIDLRIDNSRALVVTGSLSSNQADRWLSRSEIAPVQIIHDGIVYVAQFFNAFGDLGVSAFAFIDENDVRAPIYYSTGDNLYQLDGCVGVISDKTPCCLIDVHELSVVQGGIAVANTGRDEALIYSPVSGATEKRVLDSYRQDGTADERDSSMAIDRFHLNQVFEGINGDLWGLVHHVRGQQRLRNVFGKILKAHGDGGVINLDSGICIDLGLHAPHSVRIIDGEYWLMNSGRMSVCVYSRDWTLVRHFNSMGWGRGLAVFGASAYVGISPVRRRYRSVNGNLVSQPHIEVVNVVDGSSVSQGSLRYIEQVNNVYCVSSEVALKLLAL